MTGANCGFLLALLLAGCSREVAGGKADGPAVFDEVCARCHGPKGVPEPSLKAQLGVKDLTSYELQTRLSDDDIRHQILRGSANRRMPAFDSTLTHDQIDALVIHVRRLGKPAE